MRSGMAWGAYFLGARMTAQLRRLGGFIITAILVAGSLALMVQHSLAASLARWFAGVWVSTLDLVLRLIGPLFGI